MEPPDGGAGDDVAYGISVWCTAGAVAGACWNGKLAVVGATDGGIARASYGGKDVFALLLEHQPALPKPLPLLPHLRLAPLCLGPHR